MKTTLNKIRAHRPCPDGWEKLLAHLNKTRADDEPLLISAIVESNGVEDAYWCLRAVDGRDKEIRLLAVWCARQVQHLMTDKRSTDALDVSERYAHGLATKAELAAARAAAASAARAAAGDAAGAAAAYAAWDAAWTASWVAAAYAAAVWDAAAWDAAREAQKNELLRICKEIELEGKE